MVFCGFFLMRRLFFRLGLQHQLVVMDEGIDTEKTEEVGEGEGLVVTEVRKQLYLAGPLIASWLLQNFVRMISVMFVGHLGELALSSASIANSFADITGFSLLLGMASSLDTLCGQAFGAKQYYLLGIYKQRAILVLTLVSAGIAVVWSYTGQILLLFGQDPEIAAGAGSYIRWMIPALFVYAPLQCHFRFLQTQNIVLPVMLSSGVTALNHLLVCWLLVYKVGLGYKGAAFANAISYLINVSILAIYVRLAPACRSTRRGLSKEAFHDIPNFLRLGVPSALMVCLEWWSFELLVLLSGRLPNPKLETSVLSICLNTGTLAFMIPFGLSAAISIRVSNELGAGRPQAARLATRVVMVMSIVVGILIGLAMILVRNLWGYAYSNEEEVVKYVSKMMPILAVIFFFDCVQGVLSGTFAGNNLRTRRTDVIASHNYFVQQLGERIMDEGIDTEKTDEVGEGLVVTEVRKQLYLAGPLIASWLLQNFVRMISIMFIGHLGELALSSASIATSFASVTGFSLLSGMASSLDTLCGQAFGAKQYYLLGIYKQRAILVLTLVSVGVAVVWSYTGRIILLFGQDAEIAAEAGSYIRWMIPSLFVSGPLQCHVRFLQTQNIVLPVMLSSGVTALNHLVVCWVLVYKIGLGKKGAALANAISYLTNVSILAI
ncbi:Protein DETOXIFICATION 16 [Dichanthelium oligosanthes]|uniref:Protein DETOXIFICATION n=1 Tax=Dichanthelium oligosanthes TaxID=888268 RepID=A0A1E5UJ69_9POAL|nr:Protein DETOXIFICATION 16 [Dichanthelium oligosanthes]